MIARPAAGELAEREGLHGMRTALADLISRVQPAEVRPAGGDAARPGEEAAGVNSVLNAAALTYVAAFIAALGNLLWLLSIRDRRN